MIYLGTDHRGFELKEKLKAFLKEEGYKFEDLGNTIYDPDDDYPDFGSAVARRVAVSTGLKATLPIRQAQGTLSGSRRVSGAERVVENPDEDRGILLCGSGVGMDVVANKFKGVRSALVWTDDEEFVQRTREANGANVLTLPADHLTEEQAIKIVKLWLEVSSPVEERHLRRIRKVTDLESSQ